MSTIDEKINVRGNLIYITPQSDRPSIMDSGTLAGYQMFRDTTMRGIGISATNYWKFKLFRAPAGIVQIAARVLHRKVVRLRRIERKLNEHNSAMAWPIEQLD